MVAKTPSVFATHFVSAPSEQELAGWVNQTLERLTEEYRQRREICFGFDVTYQVAVNPETNQIVAWTAMIKSQWIC